MDGLLNYLIRPYVGGQILDVERAHYLSSIIRISPVALVPEVEKLLLNG